MLSLEPGDDVTFGRAEEATIRIDDQRASRKHARIWREGRYVFVDDLGSRNGTLVNGLPVGLKQRLGPGDEVTIGSSSIVVSSLAVKSAQHRILSDGEFEENLELEIYRAKRFKRPISLAVLRLACDKEAIHGRLVEMSATLRLTDVWGRFGPRDYALLLPEAERKSAQEVLTRIVGCLDKAVRHEVAYAVASVPEDARAPEALLEVARRRLRERRVGDKSALFKVGSGVVSGSRQMQTALNLAQRVAKHNTTVLIFGETGSGKQVVAEEIHRSSKRFEKPLVQLNCGALPPTLLESELFGHERGAFTGAHKRRIGHVEAASSGTLFLDEIGELPEESQPKLLHFLESQTFTRVGGTDVQKTDIRVIAATNRDLEQQVKAGRFREDLYFRLATFVIHLPPLRERLDDIEPLAQQFCRRFAKELGQEVPEFTAEAIERLKSYSWPGNVRQLRNAIERAVVLAEDGMIDACHLPERVITQSSTRSLENGRLASQLGDIEADAIRAMLAECDGNQSEAARRLGITRRALIYRMGKYGIR